jgi:hypothetical protein
MKFLIAAVLGTTLALAGPVMAQDRDSPSKHDEPKVEHRTTRHHVTYRRTYKSDEQEHQATEDLNRQYRGVQKSDDR